MKIFCIGRNYAQHAKEMGSDVPEEPIIFMKPKSALVQGHTPFYYPEFTNELHYEAEIVVRISKNGKYIQESTLPIIIMQFRWELILLPAIFSNT